jgi:hypothetical protein
MAFSGLGSQVQQLQTIMQQIDQRMVELTAQSKPTYSVDGQSISWESYFSMLSTQRKAVEEMLQRAQPYMVRTRVF